MNVFPPISGSTTVAHCRPGVAGYIDVETSDGAFFSLALTDLFPGAPVVSAIAFSGTDSAPYATNEVLEFTVTFDQPVAVTGTPRISIIINATTRQVNFARFGTTSAKLVFQYTVVGGDVCTAGQFHMPTAISLNSGTITAPQLHEDAVLTLSALDVSGVAVN